jgi:serine/threonine protein kinase
LNATIPLSRRSSPPTKLRARLTDGSLIEFEDQPIGSGGEKVAFLTTNKKNVVLFFYAGLEDRYERRIRLERILSGYNPTNGNNGDYWKSHFCWPSGLLDGETLPSAWLAKYNLLDPPLAVIAPCYRDNFFFTDKNGERREKNGKWFTSEKPRKLLPSDERGTFLGYLQACTKMARAVARMHFAGLAHSDLSNKNVLIDPKGGDASIIDIDSLVVPGLAPPVMMGTRGYIAPEVLQGLAQPGIQSDEHALAVLMYETLLLRHPLRGPKVNSSRSSEEDELLSFGKHALFIEHPNDHSNALKPKPRYGIEALGPYLSELMHRAFVEGLHEPHKRPSAADWERALYHTFDLLHPSPAIEGEWSVLDPARMLVCPFTKTRHTEAVPVIRFYKEQRPGNFVYEKRSLIVWNRLSLMPWHSTAHTLPGPNVERTPAGYFQQQGGRWYLKLNEGSSAVVIGSGPVAAGDSIELIEGRQVRFTHPSGRLFLVELLMP